MTDRRPDFYPPDPPPGLTADLDRIDSGLAELLCRPLIDDDRPHETIRTGLNLVRDLKPDTCRIAFRRLGGLPPGPLKGWWLRAVYDLPRLAEPLGSALAGFIASGTDGQDIGLEFIKKTSFLLRPMPPGPAAKLLKLTGRLARLNPQAGLSLFLSAPEQLRRLSPAAGARVMNGALRLAGLGDADSAVGLLATAPVVIDQAGLTGFSRWLKVGQNLTEKARPAYFRLDSPRARRELNLAAGGLDLETAREALRLYGRTIIGREVGILPLEHLADEAVTSLLGLGYVHAGQAYLPGREWGRDPWANYRVRLATILTAEPPPWDFILGFDEPRLAIDLWTLTAELEAVRRVTAAKPGLEPARREVNRLRRAKLTDYPLAHPAVALATRRLWGGRPRIPDDSTRELTDRLVALLGSNADKKAAVTEAYKLVVGPRGQSDHGLEVEEEPRLKFGSVDGRLFDIRVGLDQAQSERSAALGRRTGRGEFIASLDRLTDRHRHGDDTDQAAPEAVFHYPEWDPDLNDYRPQWTTVIESVPRPPGEIDPADRPGADLPPGLIKKVRRRFQRLRPRGLSRLTGQPDGHDLDTAALVRWLVDRERGQTGDDNVYQDRRIIKRDVTAALLIDLSGSTGRRVMGNGKKVLDVAKDGLVVLGEALSSLGDRFGIFGFTGSGRDRVEFQLIKDFDDPWSGRVISRLGAIEPGHQNRDGAALRHLTAKLQSQPARHKLIIYLSDGRPDDYEYSGRRAVADTNRALLEIRQAGMSAFAVTIDNKARNYFPAMMGSTGYCIIDDIRRLPAFLPLIYRRLAG